MRTILVALFITLSTFVSSAEVKIQDVEISREGEQVNIRVKLHNPGPRGDRGPIVVDLWVRANADEEWRLLKSWDDGFKLPRGYRLSRDFFSSPMSNPDPTLQGDFEVSAAVRSESSGADEKFQKAFP